MKSYIVYVNGVEVETIKAGSHNAAEKKAQKRHISVSRVNEYIRLNPHRSREEAFKRLGVSVSVVYTEV